EAEDLVSQRTIETRALRIGAGDTRPFILPCFNDETAGDGARLALEAHLFATLLTALAGPGLDGRRPAGSRAGGQRPDRRHPRRDPGPGKGVRAGPGFTARLTRRYLVDSELDAAYVGLVIDGRGQRGPLSDRLARAIAARIDVPWPELLG